MGKYIATFTSKYKLSAHLQRILHKFNDVYQRTTHIPCLQRVTVQAISSNRSDHGTN